MLTIHQVQDAQNKQTIVNCLIIVIITGGHQVLTRGSCE